MNDKGEYPDPFKKMAEDLVKAGSELVEKTRNERPTCPNCDEKLWKRKDGQFSCPNRQCEREVIPPEEIATRKIVNKFLGSL